MAGLWGCRCAWSWRRARLWGFVSKLTLGLLCPRSNTVYSPAAIFEMLRIMRLGAAGKTARELEGLLGAVDAEGDWMGLSPVDDWAYEGYEAALTLGVWFDRAAWPSEGFAAACARPCMACERVDFSDSGAGTAVSNWIDEATGGLFHPALRFDANALAAIVSVLYLKDTWGSSSFRAMLRGHPSTPRRGRCKRSTWLTFGGLRVYDGAFGTVVSRPLSHGASMRFLLPEEGMGLEWLLREGLLDKALSARLGRYSPRSSICPNSAERSPATACRSCWAPGNRRCGWARALPSSPTAPCLTLRSRKSVGAGGRFDGSAPWCRAPRGVVIRWSRYNNMVEMVVRRRTGVQGA